MFDTVCTLPLSDDLFAQALHPREPLLGVGLASGHVATLRLPSTGDDAVSESSTSGVGHINTNWRTRRHKGSCRTLDFSIDGDALYSAGTDGIVKVADTATGRVTSKIAVPSGPRGAEDAPTLLHALTPQAFLLATDSSALYLYDIREDHTFASRRPQQTHHPHDDYISSLTPIPPTEASTSGFSKQWVTTGGTTLAVTDIRRGVLIKSEAQEEELLSSVWVDGLTHRGTGGSKAVVGASDGVLTLWERGNWDDQDERMYVDKGGMDAQTIDALAMVPEGISRGGKIVACGLGGGGIRLVQLGANKVIGELSHHEVDGVTDLGFDVEGRMISGGGQTIKVWHEAVETADTLEGAEEADSDSDIDVGDDIDDVEAVNGADKRPAPDASDEEKGSDKDSEADSSEEEKTKKKRKKRKKGKSRFGGRKPNMDFKGLD